MSLYNIIANEAAGLDKRYEVLDLGSYSKLSSDNERNDIVNSVFDESRSEMTSVVLSEIENQITRLIEGPDYEATVNSQDCYDG